MGHACAKFVDRGNHVFGGASHPLALYALEALFFKTLTNRGVAKRRSVITLGKLIDLNDILDTIHTL
jgi:hypothetical protein